MHFFITAQWIELPFHYICNKYTETKPIQRRMSEYIFTGIISKIHVFNLFSLPSSASTLDMLYCKE